MGAIMTRPWMGLLVVLSVPLVVNGQQRGNAMPMPAAAPHMVAPVRVAAPAAPVTPAAAPKASIPTAGAHSQMRPAVVNPHGAHAPGHAVGPKAPVKTRGDVPHPSAGQGKAHNGPVYVADGSTGYPVPGLGFDYVHYAAVHPNAYTDGQRHFGYGSSVPFLSGSWYVPMYYPVEGAPVAEAATEVPATEASEPAEGEAVLNETPAAAPAEKPVKAAIAPLAPSAEYTFVRRDGTVFFAVGYSWQGEKLQYVTQDGMRRSVPLADLDLDATSKFNEQRGVTFRSPA